MGKHTLHSPDDVSLFYDVSLMFKYINVREWFIFLCTVIS